jgi:phospholipid/cholesterol/gamma-HCH transport system substrate-binding protein/paraquat-inducible protein B
MAEQSRWKLGFVVAAGGLGAYVGLLMLAAQLKAAEPLIAITYLDESVQGLREGAKVQMRGVTIGRVKGFDLAEDHRHVEVRCELDDRTLRMLGIRDAQATWGQGEFAPPSLRAFLASSGLTGVLVIQLDFYDPKKHPLPQLDFDPPWNYVPAIASFQKTVQRDIPTALANLPGYLDDADEILADVDSLLTELDLAGVSSQTRTSFASATASVDSLDVAAISTDLCAQLESMTAALRSSTEQLRAFEENPRLDDALGEAERLAGVLQERIDDFRAGGGLKPLHETTAALADMARGLSHALQSLREWVSYLRRKSNAFDDTLRPLGEDPSELFFGKEPRRPPD